VENKQTAWLYAKGYLKSFGLVEIDVSGSLFHCRRAGCVRYARTRLEIAGNGVRVYGTHSTHVFISMVGYIPARYLASGYLKTGF